jgi:hypothetical protein
MPRIKKISCLCTPNYICFRTVNTFIPLSVVKRQPMMLMKGQTGQDGLYQSTGYSEGQESANFYAAFSGSSPAEYQLPLRSRESAQQPAAAGLYELARPAVRYDPARPSGNYHRDSGVYLGGPSPGYASELDLSGRYRSYKDSSGDQGRVLGI